MDAKEYINPAPIQSQLFGMNGLGLVWGKWFTSIEKMLGQRNSQVISFTPTFTSLTEVGTATITGNYYRFNTMVFFDVKIVPGTNTSSTAGTTYINNLPFLSAVDGQGQTDNISTNISIGSGPVLKSTGTLNGKVRHYTPTWATVTDSISITGNYRIII